MLEQKTKNKRQERKIKNLGGNSEKNFNIYLGPEFLRF